MPPRRLIEDSLPLAAISEQSAREKYIRQGHISTLHLWWARRPLAACRAAVYASLVDAPSSDEERQKLHERIKKLVNWDTLNPEHPDHGVLEEARQHIRECHAARIPGTTGNGEYTPPRVIDPFSGGGAIPLEAQRLGCTTFANDLNPVAHVIELGSLVYPQMFANQVNVEEEPEPASLPMKLTRNPKAKVKTEQRLVTEVRRWSRIVYEEVAAELRDIYPASGPGREVLGYLWARHTQCSNPSCRALIPVVNQTWLANKPKRKIAYRIDPTPDRKAVTYSIHEGGAFDFDPDDGTYGNNTLTCPCCGQVTSGEHLRAEGMAGRLQETLILVVEVSTEISGRFYRLPGHGDHEAGQRARLQAETIESIEGDISPDRPSSNARGLSAVTRYGMLRFGDLFNPRQTVVLDHFSRKIVELADRLQHEYQDDQMAEAVAVYLALALDRLANQCSRLARWDNTGEKIQGVFSKQAVAMIWDYIESNPLGSATASWEGAVDWGLQVIAQHSFPNPATVWLGSATELAVRGEIVDAVITDPPYYDSVPYSDISDFFYVWQRRTLGRLFPDVFSSPLTPKRREIIQHNPRHGGEKAARAFYEQQMTLAFQEMGRICEDDGIVVIVFAHKSTAAWETLLSSLLSADLVVTASWPIDTEMGSRTGAQDAASLASSVFIVCRKRTAHDDGFLDDVEPDLTARLDERLDYFWSQGIRGADFFMSAIGPAVEVFGRYKRVLRLDGEVVKVGHLLDMVRRMVADYALNRIVKGVSAGDVDEESRFYVLWRWAFVGADVECGEAIHMAQSMGCEFSSLISDKGMLEKKGDKVSLRGPFDRTKVRHLGALSLEHGYAPLIDVLHRAAQLWSAGDRQGLSDFLADALPPGALERLHRLAQSIVDVLAPGDKERNLYENFLVGSRNLPPAVPRGPVATLAPEPPPQMVLLPGLERAPKKKGKK